MKLAKLCIENYRNFRRLDLDLEPDCTILIGENNSGKTNVLEALYACLRANRVVRQGAFEASDFHLPNPQAFPGEAGPIRLTGTFAEATPGSWDVQIVSALEDAINLEPQTGRRSITIRVEGTAPTNKDEADYEWSFLDQSGTPKPQKLITSLNRLQTLRPLEYLDAFRDAGREFSQRSTYFGPFVRDPRFDDTLREELLQALADINSRVLEAHTVFAVLKQNLDAGHSVVQSTDVDPARIEAVPSRLNDLLSNTQISFQNPDGVPLPLSLHGSGTQSLSVLSLFRAYVAAKLAAKGEPMAEPILMIEEPETHLHPSGARAAWSLLSTLTGQTIVTSHSGDLVGVAPLRCIRRITRNAGTVVCRRVDESAFTEDELPHIDFYVRLARGELLFANAWILVEGKSELCLLEGIAFAAGVDLYAHGVRIIAHSEHGRVAPYIKLADQLGINWHCICDGDADGTKDAETARNLLLGRDEALHISMLDAPNLEIFLCNHGFSAEYQAAVPGQRRAEVTLQPGQAGYCEQLFEVTKKRKVEVAIEIAKRIKANPDVLPELLRRVIDICREHG